MRIFLVRHGLSEANKNKALHKELSDHAIPLSEEGKDQAKRARQALDNYSGICLGSNRVWVSPYLRTRQTATNFIGDGFLNVRGIYMPEVREDITLVEQQYGLFDGLEDDELKIKYPEEQAHYEKCEKAQGKFYARMPLGESRFDVVLRVHQMFGTWKRDEEKHGIKNLIVVSHGVTIRAIVMRWLHKSVEWFEAEPNPGNCSIQLIENNDYKGFIFKGFDKQGKLIE